MPVVTGDVKRIAGTTVTSGEVRFTATTPVVQDPDGNTTSLATSVAEHVVTLGGTGSFSTTLPATGDDWVYRVEISAHVGANKVQGLPRLLLEVPASGADLSDAGVEGSPSGRVVVNRLVGRTELTAAVAPIQQTADNALTTAQAASATADNAADRVDSLEVMGGVQPGSVNDAEMALHAQQEDGLFHAALDAATAKLLVEPPMLTPGAWVPGSSSRPLVADKTRILVEGSSSDRNMADALQTIIDTETDWGSIQVINRAVSGERFQHAGARQGVFRDALTFPENTIPASGSTPVESMFADTYGQFGYNSYKGTVAGVHGTFSRTGSSPYTYRFTRTTAGDPIPVAGPVEFVADPADSGGLAHHRDAVLIHGGGKNNSSDDEDPTRLVDAWDVASVARMVPLVPTYFVNGMFVSSGSASLRRGRVNTMNAARAARFGDRFLDVTAYLSSPQVWEDTGITPDAQSLTQQSQGELPHQLTDDNEHMDDLTTYWAVWRVWIPALAPALGFPVPESPTPPDLTSNLTADLTFEYLRGTVPNGSEITSVTPQAGDSAGALYLGTTGSNFPTLDHTSGPVSLQFDGSQSIRTTGSDVLIDAGEPITVVTVARVTNAGSWSRLVTTGSATDGYRAAIFGPDGTLLGGDTVGTGTLDAGAPWPNAEWFVSFVVWNADGTVKARINDGPAVMGISASLPNWRGLGLMSATNGSSATTGRLRRVMIFNRAFTKFDMDAMHAQLVADDYLA